MHKSLDKAIIMCDGVREDREKNFMQLSRKCYRVAERGTMEDLQNLMREVETTFENGGLTKKYHEKLLKELAFAERRTKRRHFPDYYK